jgi:16S rRNA (cytosine967-C5)-methyltransferase
MKPTPPLFQGLQHTARSLALQILLDGHPSGQQRSFVGETLDRRLEQFVLSPLDRRLAAQLVYGVLRRQGTLNSLLRPLLTRSPEKVEPWLREILCLGAFQLAFLSQIPPHAALHETVELAAQFGRPLAKGFVNGVLRALTRLLTDDIGDQPAADRLPLTPDRFRRLERPVFPDPVSQPGPYLTEALSLPAWLAQRWLARQDWQECMRLGFWFAGPGPLTLRCNPLRIERSAFLAACTTAGLHVEAGIHPQAVAVSDSVAIPAIPGYAEGWFAVQDESAMAAGSALGPKSGWRVLDLCAAPGGKTTHLGEQMQGQGEIVACDVDERRLKIVDDLARRLGSGLIRTCLIRADDDGSVPRGPFDAVLVDVPCSNTGVLGRRPEARWRLKPADLQYLVALQTRLLTLAVDRTRPGGRIVYSTCSIEPEENSGVVRAVLQARPELELEAEQEAIPGRPADGGYWARLRR